MNNHDQLNSNLRVGLAIETGMAIAAQKQATILDQQSEIAKLRAEQRTVTRRSDGEYEAMLAQRQVEVLRAELMLKDDALREKNALILEWMHCADARLMMARQYGKKLGLTDEERLKNYRECVVKVAEDDPKFANTELGAKAKENLNK